MKKDRQNLPTRKRLFARAARTFNRATSCLEELMQASLFSRSLGALMLLLMTLTCTNLWAGDVTVKIFGSGTVDVTNNGTTTVENITSGWNMYLSGSLTLTMTPAQGYTLQELQIETTIGSETVNPSENNGVFTYTTRNVGLNTITYTVVFSQPETTIYTLSGSNSMTFSVGGQIVDSAEEGQRVDITLPAPGNNSYWYVSSKDVAIQKDDASHFHFTMPAKSVIVSAQIYTQTGSYVLDESTTHGHVIVNGNSAGTESHYTDETITLTPMADVGYEYLSGTLTATNGNTSESINLAYNGDGTWSFTMPNVYVTVAATFAPAPAHFEQTATNEYTIHSAAGWGVFCDLLDENEKGYFTGKTVKLDASIEVSRMAGSAYHDFIGTFNGQGNTLTFAYSATEAYAAPFRYVEGPSATVHAAIQNLNVKSTITGTNCRHLSGLIALSGSNVDVSNCNVEVDITSNKGTDDNEMYPSGLLSQCTGPVTISGCTVTGKIATNGKYAAGILCIVQGTATIAKITNCVSSVTINSSTAGDGTHGGLVAVSYPGSTTIEGCLFNGKLLTVGSTDTKNCGGFVGWRTTGTVTISNSLYAPADLDDGETEVKFDENESYPSATFVRNGSTGTNCYYTRALGTVQGTQAYSITAGENVTVAFAETPTSTYSTSGIATYTTGIKCNNVLYAGSGNQVSLTLGHSVPTGCTFTGFTVSPTEATLTGTDNPYTLTMPAENVTISAAFDQIDYSINIDGLNGGSMSVSVNGAPATTAQMMTAHYNDEITLTITPATGYKLMNVWVNEDELYPSQGVYSFQMPAENVTLSAVFEPISYSIGVAHMEHGFVSVSVDDAHYNDKITLVITPDEGYAVKYVKYNDTVIHPQNGTYSFRMPSEDVTITAVFDVPKDPVSYLDENGKQQSVNVYEVLSGNEETLETGWYVLNSDIDYSDRITVSGDAFLILSDNCTLTAEDGIDVPPVSSLTIFAQSDGDNAGVLNALAENNYSAAAIGGSQQSAGTITINGGMINAIGGEHGAAIGGGQSGSGGTIVINGGTVNAEGNSSGCDGSGACIGGGTGGSAGSITINGGTVNATGNWFQPGIGNGTDGTGGNITINGGKVTSDGGYNGNNGINVSGGTITLGYTNATDFIHASSYIGTVKIADGKTFTDGTHTYNSETLSSTLTALTDATLVPASALSITVGDCAHGTVNVPVKAFKGERVTVTATADEGYALKNIKVNGTPIRPINGVYAFIMPNENVTLTATFLAPQTPVAYLDENGASQSAVYYEVLSGTESTLDTGWYVLDSDRNFSGTITVLGDIHLILADGCTMSITADVNCIDIGSSLTIYSQAKGSGTLFAQSNYSDGINAGDGKSLTINGGNVTVTGGTGICTDQGGNVTINGGNVTATGNDYGIFADRGIVNINGGNVIVSGSTGIYDYHGGTITLGWTNYDDRILVSNYKVGVVRITKTITDGTNTYLGDPEDDYIYDGYLDALAGTPLYPYLEDFTLADDADNTADIALADGMPANVTIQGRTLYKDNSWNTLCLPFALTAEQVTAQLAPDALMTLKTSDFSGGTLTLTFEDATEITAGKPYIIKWSDDGSDNLVNPTFTGVTISNATASVETDHVDFIGTYAPNDIYTEEKTNLYLGADNTLYYPWSDNMEHFYVNAFRGYFQLKNGLACGEPVQNGSGINAFVLHFGKETNSIENGKLKIENDDNSWYSLDGRKLTGKPAQKGIYINNGKKVVIK